METIYVTCTIFLNHFRQWNGGILSLSLSPTRDISFVSQKDYVHPHQDKQMVGSDSRPRYFIPRHIFNRSSAINSFRSSIDRTTSAHVHACNGWKKARNRSIRNLGVSSRENIARRQWTNICRLGDRVSISKPPLFTLESNMHEFLRKISQLDAEDIAMIKR